MKKITLLFTAMGLLCAGNMAAQDEAATPATPTQYAELRAAAYVEAFGLGEREAEKLAQIFLEGEEQVAGLREQPTSERVQTRIEETMLPYDAHAERMLNEEQKSKLEQMKKEGTWHPGGASCTSAKAKSCAGHGEGAKAGGCCAGKGGAHDASAPNPKPTPVHSTSTTVQ